MLKVYLFFLLSALSLAFFKTQAFANPDDLLIQDDGMVILLVSDGDVLASETKSDKKAETATPPTKTIPLVQAHTESAVKITPPTNNDKKVQVTITPTPKTPAPTAPVKSSFPQQKTPVPAPTSAPIVKTVDQVVAQGSNGQPVFSIKSDKANQLTIKEGSTNVSTSLPLQINTATHSLSVPSETGSANVSVLPSEAIKGISDKGILDDRSINLAKIDLTKDTGKLNYTLNSEESKKLFGTLDVKYPVEVKLSAENGKVVNVSKPVLFSLLKNFLK